MRTKRAGFTLLEIVVTVMVLTIIAGITIPLAKNLINEAKANKLIELVNYIKMACMRYYQDTGWYATEIGMDGGGGNVHNLFESPGGGLTRWNGPYIEKELSAQANPCHQPGDGGIIFVDASVTNSVVSPMEFDLKGDGNFITGPGNSIGFKPVPEEIAKLVDSSIDKGLDEANWKTTGRVLYDKNQASMAVFLLKD